MQMQGVVAIADGWYISEASHAIQKFFSWTYTSFLF